MTRHFSKQKQKQKHVVETGRLLGYTLYYKDDVNVTVLSQIALLSLSI